MQILIINEFGNAKRMTAQACPRIGDKVDLFYIPLPTVKDVVWFPSDNTLARIGQTFVDAIVTVG
jgi:hypothetical protein